MSEALGIVVRTFAVALGAFGILLGLLDVITAIQEDRPLVRGLVILAGGLLLFVPVFAKAFREALVEARNRGS